MKTILQWSLIIAAVLSAGALARAQGTAFTYQGQLNDNGAPATGIYDFQFRLALDPLGNTYVGSPFLTNGLAVNNGLVTTALDFGQGLFTGTNYWLEVNVRTNGGSAYTSLTPLQAVTPAPYAIMANSTSNLLGTLPASQLSGPIPASEISGVDGKPVMFTNINNAFVGSFFGNGAGLTNVAGSSVVISGTSLTAVPNTSYVATNASLTTVTLPATANVGDVVQICGAGAGGWQAVGDISDSQAVPVWTPASTPARVIWSSVASSADGTHLVAAVLGGGDLHFVRRRSDMAANQCPSGKVGKRSLLGGRDPSGRGGQRRPDLHLGRRRSDLAANQRSFGKLVVRRLVGGRDPLGRRGFLWRDLHFGRRWSNVGANQRSFNPIMEFRRLLRGWHPSGRRVR
jgi:hypothetical protein